MPHQSATAVGAETTKKHPRNACLLGMTVDAHGTTMPHRHQMRLATCIAAKENEQQQQQQQKACG
jgi:hypothetical protein